MTFKDKRAVSQPSKPVTQNGKADTRSLTQIRADTAQNLWKMEKGQVIRTCVEAVTLTLCRNEQLTNRDRLLLAIQHFLSSSIDPEAIAICNGIDGLWSSELLEHSAPE